MSRAKLGTGRALSKPIQWLLRDEFSDTRAAGSVNGTMPTPGPGGARVVTDTNSILSISSGTLSQLNGASSSDPRLHYQSISRSVGLVFIATGVNYSTGNQRINCGWYANTSGSNDEENVFACINNLRGGTKAYAPTLGSPASLTGINFFLPLRATGSFYLVSGGGTWAYPTLVWIDATLSNTPLYPGTKSYTGTNTIDSIRIPSDLWIPVPLVSDGFGSSFGTSDGLGHAETTGIGSGGGNATWTQQVGTWTVSSSKAAAATLSGGVAVATVPLSTKDVFAKVKVTRSAGSGGMVLRWTDANNHLYTEHDGTNAYLKQVLSGSTTTLITAAATYSAGAELVPDLNGTAARLYWNNALVGSTSSISSSLTSTLHGLRSTDTGGIQLDDFVVYAKGTGGEYNLLNRYVNL
jgi:hypothetical protein